MFISNCIAQLLAFVPCRLEHATYRSHEAKMVSGPSIHTGRRGPSEPVSMRAARSIMVKHSGIPSEAPLLLNSPKKTDTYDACPYCMASMWPLPDGLRKLTARLSPCSCLVRFYICFVAAASLVSAHTKCLAPSSGSHLAPSPAVYLYCTCEERGIWQSTEGVAQKTTLAQETRRPGKELLRESQLSNTIGAYSVPFSRLCRSAGRQKVNTNKTAVLSHLFVRSNSLVLTPPALAPGHAAHFLFWHVRRKCKKSMPCIKQRLFYGEKKKEDGIFIEQLSRYCDTDLECAGMERA
ncbi:hypothetical protein GGI43DRAFT_272641 [Trichoderma evansii]